MTALPPAQGVTVRAVRRLLGPDGGVRRGIERRFARRRARRRLVVVWTGVLVAAMVLPLTARLQDAFGPAVLVDGLGSWLDADLHPFPTPLVPLLLAGALGWVLRTAVGRAADLPDEDIDERQIALRDRTYLVAYRIIGSTVLVLVLAAYIVADAAATRTVSASFAAWLMSDVFFLLAPLVAFLPSAVLAWYLPDAPEAE